MSWVVFLITRDIHSCFRSSPGRYPSTPALGWPQGSVPFPAIMVHWKPPASQTPSTRTTVLSSPAHRTDGARPLSFFFNDDSAHSVTKPVCAPCAISLNAWWSFFFKLAFEFRIFVLPSFVLFLVFSQHQRYSLGISQSCRFTWLGNVGPATHFNADTCWVSTCLLHFSQLNYPSCSPMVAPDCAQHFR